MKKFFSLCLSLFAAFVLFGQGTKVDVKNVPEPVLKKFKAFYGEIKKVTWEKEENNYEATFKQNKVKTSVVLTADGNIIAKEWEVKKGAVPKAITDSIAKNFAGYKVEEYCKIEKGGLVTYEAEV